MKMLSPEAVMPSIEGVFFRNHTRCWKRKSLSSSAPTGQMSTTLPDSSLSSAMPGKTSICSIAPRPSTINSPVPVTSRVKRTHRVHMMQRSEYSST